MTKAKLALRELLDKGLVVAPGVYDCISTRMMEVAGFEAVAVTRADVAACACGLPDPALLSLDEMVWVLTRIAFFSSGPVVAELGTGFGETSLAAWNAARRIAKAGAAAIVVDDAEAAGRPPLARAAWFERLLAVRDAAEGACLLVARTGAEGAEAVDRALKAIELGFDLAGHAGTGDAEASGRFAAAVGGRALWSAPAEGGGMAGSDFAGIAAMGHALMIAPFARKGAMYGMLDYGRRTMAERTTVYHDEHDFDGLLPGGNYQILFDFYRKWVPLEERFRDVA